MSWPQLEDTAAPAFTLQGVYAGAGAYRNALAFGKRTQTDIQCGVDFIEVEVLNDERSLEVRLACWPPQFPISLGIPLVGSHGRHFSGIVSGGSDEVFLRLGRCLVKHGHSSAVLRLAYEFNGDWFGWSAVSDPETFVPAFRRAASLLRATSGSQFRIEWNVNLGGVCDPVAFYPGDEFADVIGLCAYDQETLTYNRLPYGAKVNHPYRSAKANWEALLDAPRGLRWHRQFAQSRRKPMSFPEWGVINRPDGRGGGDNPDYIVSMATWFRDVRPLYHGYFEYNHAVGDSRLSSGMFPRALQAFAENFGE